MSTHNEIRPPYSHILDVDLPSYKLHLSQGLNESICTIGVQEFALLWPCDPFTIYIDMLEYPDRSQSLG